MNKHTFEEFLQNEFMKLREIGGMPITKDNSEDLFENWVSNLYASEIGEYAEEWGKQNIEKLLLDFSDPHGPSVEELRKEWL